MNMVNTHESLIQLSLNEHSAFSLLILHMTFADMVLTIQWNNYFSIAELGLFFPRSKFIINEGVAFASDLVDFFHEYILPICASFRSLIHVLHLENTDVLLHSQCSFGVHDWDQCSNLDTSRIACLLLMGKIQIMNSQFQQKNGCLNWHMVTWQYTYKINKYHLQYFIVHMTVDMSYSLQINYKE